MQIIVLISIFASVCIAGPIEEDATSSASPAIRWINLHRRIFDGPSEPRIGIHQLESILRSMSLIEVTESDFKNLITLQGFQSNVYDDLIDKAYGLHYIEDRDTTITSLLLRTFDLNWNHCTTEQFDLLDDIYKGFEQSPIHEALGVNRELQHKNCLRRLMDIMTASVSILGHNFRTRLDTLASSVYPTRNDIETSVDDPNSPTYEAESIRIAKIIAQFLKSSGSKSKDKNFAHEFQQFVENPCELLIDTSIHVMTQIYGISRFCGIKRDSITNRQAIALNRYKLCDRIMADTEFIASYVIQFSMAQEEPRFQLNPRTIEQRSSGDLLIDKEKEKTKKKPSKRKRISTELRLGFNDDDGCDQLITQQMPLDDENSSMDMLPSRASEMSDVIQLAKIIGTHGKSVKTKYIVVWSDGVKSMESKAYLHAYWPDQLRTFLKRKAANHQARYIDRCLAKKTAILLGPNTGLDETDEPGQKRARESNELPRVIRVGKTTARGLYATYPTYWSDGSKTWEKKDYLSLNWFDAWKNRIESQDEELSFLTADESEDDDDDQ